MNNAEQGSFEPSQELSREQKLRIAKDLSSNYFQVLVDKNKANLKGSENELRENLDLSPISFVGHYRANLEGYRLDLEKSKKGDFFTSRNGKSSLFDFLRRELAGLPSDIDDLIKEKGPNHPNVKELQIEKREIRSIIEAIEATDEFREFQMGSNPEKN